MRVRQDLVGSGLVLAAPLLWGTTGTARALAPAGTSPLSVGGGPHRHWRRRAGGRGRPARRAGLGWTMASRSARGRRGCRRRLPARLLLGGGPHWRSRRHDGGDRQRAHVGRPARLAGPGRAATWPLVCRDPAGPDGLLAVAGQPVRFSRDGVTLAVVAGAAYAVYTVVAKELLAGHGQVQVMAALFGGGALLLVPVAAH